MVDVKLGCYILAQNIDAIASCTCMRITPRVCTSVLSFFMQRCFQSKYLRSNSAEGLHFSAFHSDGSSHRSVCGHQLELWQEEC